MKIEHLFKPSNLGITELFFRLTSGFAMLYHGYGKLMAIDRYTELFTKLGIEPANIMVVVAGLGETFGGLALIFGIFTRLGALSSSITMVTAFIYIGWPKGYNIIQGGYEYQLTMFAIFFFFIVNGAGKYSLDKLIHNKLSKW